MSKRIAAIVLAAGASSRMRASTDGETKLTLELDGRAIVAFPVSAMLGAGAEPIIVVVAPGARGQAVREALTGSACEFVTHENAEAGIGSSIACGVRALARHDANAPQAGRSGGVLVCLGDMPLLRARHVAPLVAAFGAGTASSNSICTPTSGGRRGHPVLFGSAHYAALAGLEGDEGARSIVAARPEHVIEVPTLDDAILVDVDTPEDLAALRDTGSDATLSRAPR